MQLVSGMNGGGGGGSVGYKQICAMEASLVSNRITVLCKGRTARVVTDRSE